jgi:hypothetical protein
VQRPVLYDCVTDVSIAWALSKDSSLLDFILLILRSYLLNSFLDLIFGPFIVYPFHICRSKVSVRPISSGQKSFACALYCEKQSK